MQEPGKTITVDMLHRGERSSATARLYVNYIDIVSLVRAVPLHSLGNPFVSNRRVFRVISNVLPLLSRVPIGPPSSKSRHPETVFPGLYHTGN